jgi:SagB-type dehydrogenase family enzyme
VSNADVAVGDKYWQDTFLTGGAMMARGLGEEGSADEPPKFKGYLGLPRRPLPSGLPSALGPIDTAFTPAASAGPLDLGSLLYYGYGFSRVDVGPLKGWPYHRTVPSARCFYPTELYVVLPGDGVYHYDQLHHALVRLRTGDHLDVLAAATGSDLAGAQAVAVLTSHFWKTAFRYRHYAYRLCTQEAGMVAGNLMMVASALGRTAHLHLQFLDDVVDRLLGVTSGEERTVAVLPIYAAGRPGPRRLDAGPVAGFPAIDVAHHDVEKDISLAEDTYRVDAASVLGHTDEIVAGRVATPWPGDAPVLPLPARMPDLAGALRRRHSGGTLFRPVERPLATDELGLLTRFVTEAYPSDLGDTPLGTAYYVVQNVDGVEPGVYRGEGRGLRRVGELPDRLDPSIIGPPVMDVPAVNVLCYLVTDREETARWGNRGYRIANIDAGVTAQRLAVLAGASGIAARPVNGYQTVAIQKLLGTALTPMFQIGLGRRSSSAQYEMPIVF